MFFGPSLYRLNHRGDPAELCYELTYHIQYVKGEDRMAGHRDCSHLRLDSRGRDYYALNMLFIMYISPSLQVVLNVRL
jgi:hypothetical protein